MLPFRTTSAAITAATLTLVTLGGCESRSSTQTMGYPRPPEVSAPANADHYFLIVASHINAAEIDSGELAQQRAENAQVRQYARQMVEDHMMADRELNELARTKGVTLPRRPDEMHLMLTDHLSQLSGEAFDREYISSQVSGHARALSIFEDKARQAQDPDVRAWAARQIPALREHLARAQQLNRQLGGASSIGSSMP